jgi:hypothetical protein
MTHHSRSPLSAPNQGCLKSSPADHALEPHSHRDPFELGRSWDLTRERMEISGERLTNRFNGNRGSRDILSRTPFKFPPSADCTIRSESSSTSPVRSNGVHDSIVLGWASRLTYPIPTFGISAVWESRSSGRAEGSGADVVSIGCRKPRRITIGSTVPWKRFI